MAIPYCLPGDLHHHHVSAPNHIASIPNNQARLHVDLAIT